MKFFVAGVRRRDYNGGAMNDNELAAITIRLPTAMRDEIKNRAEAENRSITGFVRHHLAPVLAAGLDVSNEPVAEILRNSLPVEHEAAPDVPKQLMEGLA